MTWGTSLSESARRDLEALIDAGLRAADPIIADARWLPPMPFVVTLGGELRALAVDEAAQPDRNPVRLVGAAIRLLREEAIEARAVALATGSRLEADRTDVVEVWAEHREGAAITVLRPYPRRGARADERAYRGSRLIWPGSND